MTTKLDANQVIQALYNETTGGLNVTPISGTLVSAAYDYISVSYPSATTEVFTYKSGGSGGTTVSTITVSYTDGTKENISTVART